MKAGKKRTLNNSVIHTGTYCRRRTTISEQLKLFRVPRRWTWNQTTYWVRNVCFMFWQLLMHGQWEAEYTAVWQEGRLQFSYCWAALFLRVQHTEFMFYSWSVMRELVLNIKTVLTEGNCWRSLIQGYLKPKLVLTPRKFYGRHHDLVEPYKVAVSRLISDLLPR